MKNLILGLIIYLSFTSCKNSNYKIEFDSSKINEVNNIVEAIIIQDSLDVLKSKKESSYFLENLVKLNIIIPVKEKKGVVTIPLPFFNNVTSEHLITRKINDKLFFTKIDSANIVSQNSYPNELKLAKKIMSEINSITIEEVKAKRKKEEYLNLYTMSIPIFSLDNKKAYVQLDNHCGRLCGEGIEIFLEKINGKWKIIFKQGTWVS
jgi:hypothetical protein